ncbi:MAG: hypothetical protein IJC15_08710 [Clostridia bacterium]|nr:hypothetical protein [Clostridia bacterium]
MKFAACLCALLATLFLMACGGEATPMETAAKLETAEMTTTTQAPDPLAVSVAAGGERWLEEGYTFWTGERALTLDMKAFLGNSAGWTYLSLTDDLFLVDCETSGQVAGHFFAFVMEQYGADALFDLSRREACKDAFVKSYYPEKSYAFAGEEVLAGMDCREEDGKYIITLEGAEYVAQAEGYLNQISRTLILYNVLARRQLMPLLRELDPEGKIFTPTAPLTYQLVLGSGESVTDAAAGEMTIRTYDAMLHQTLHAWGLTDRRADHHWLTEGLCSYFGIALGLDQWVVTNYHYWLILVESGQLPASADASAAVRRYRREYEAYAALGGSAGAAETFSLPLLLHAKARCDRQDGGVDFQTLCAMGDDTCTEAESASLTLYLIERCGLTDVLAVWCDYDRFGEIFGGSEAEIFAAWQAWLDAE